MKPAENLGVLMWKVEDTRRCAAVVSEQETFMNRRMCAPVDVVNRLFLQYFVVYTSEQC